MFSSSAPLVAGGLPPRPLDLLSVPATLWFAALERALHDGDLDGAARAHAELRTLGVTVRITAVGAPQRRDAEGSPNAH
jgi:hypothetical protein